MDTTTVTLEDLSDPYVPGGEDWNDTGVVVLPGLISDDLIADYEAEWKASNGFRSLTPVNNRPGLHVLDADNRGGWDETAYMRHQSLMDICTHPRIATVLAALTGEPMAVHLNLTGWVSTKRDWHQDTYLNPEHVGDYYAAVWVALGDVHEDSGPFQYVPGSHRWHTLKQAKVLAHVDGSDPEWPAHTERILTPLIETEIRRRGAEVVTYLPKRGDVLIWHGRLYHRGTVPNVAGAYRPALIAHYSGITHRRDMPAAVRHDNGGWYFPLHTQAPLARARMTARGD